MKKRLLIITVVAGCAALFFFFNREEKVDFSAEVKPILNKKCISCHGGVKKEGGFSVLFREEAIGNTSSGKPAIIPGKPSKSEFIRRLTLDDPEERMPYKHDPLPQHEIDLLTGWVKQGAEWGEHWAYTAVQPVEPPQPRRKFFGLLPGKPWEGTRNEIDLFIREVLDEQGLTPSPEADRRTLLRRVSLDLTGVPAPQSIAEAFLRDSSANAYEWLVDSLLASPRFGERWAAVWMDLARYSDTKGYERDPERHIWRYRDWLIRAFNQDMPYDQFLTEQIAGDLLPDATDDQLVATAYHRNTMTNDEGGTDNEEFRVAAVMDRVNATWDGILGTTFSCVQCHSHPYDPFRFEEYYKFYAFFNNTRDEDTFADYPLLRHYNAEDSTKRAQLVKWLHSRGYAKQAREVDLFLRTWQPSIHSIAADSMQLCEQIDTKWLGMRSGSSARLRSVDLTGKNQLIYRYIAYAHGGVWNIYLDSVGGRLLKTISVPRSKAPEFNWSIMKVDLPEVKGVHDLYISYTNPSMKITDGTGIMFDWWHFASELPGSDEPGHGERLQTYWQLLTKNVETTPIMLENPEHMRRPTYVFERGNWLVHGDEVEPGVPASLNPLPEGAPRNRLGLAMWLTDKSNPLTSRAMVNRVWEQLFGTGIAETLEDLGTQGIEPTHRELLDFLAYRFMHDMEWSTKKLMRAIVLSATYRQDSKVTPEHLQKDAFNRYLARGPRVRLSAEQIRDQALAVSGLLSDKMYGPGVKPYQPEGVWMSPYGSHTWEMSEGEDRLRRAVYTFWKRTAPYPSLLTFDAAAREVCTVRRIRTNTPLQALVLLNDSVYWEAARHFAWQVKKENPSADPAAQIGAAYQRATLRPIDEGRLQALTDLYNEAFRRFHNQPETVRQVLGVKDAPEDPEMAALIMVMSALLNTDEIVTKS